VTESHVTKRERAERRKKKKKATKTKRIKTNRCALKWGEKKSLERAQAERSGNQESNGVFHRPRPGVPGRRGVRGVGGATGVIRRSLAGASCARSTSRAALLASSPTCAGGRAASTRASARNRSRDSDGSARRCGRYVESAGAGCEAGLAGRCVRAWRVCDRWAKRRSRSVSATLVARAAVLTREWSSSVCACEASVKKVGMRNYDRTL
jgi:hypothetical protein